MRVTGRRRRGDRPSGPRTPPGVVERLADGDVRWRQAFRWGLLMAFDAEHPWELPADVGGSRVAATRSCLTVPVRHAQDVEPDDVADVQVEVVVTDGLLTEPVHHSGELVCPSGRLEVGDADEHRVVVVPPGALRVQVRLEPAEHAERVVVALVPAG